MTAAVAVQRKLLELRYIIFKTQKPLDPDLFLHRENSTKSQEYPKTKKEIDEIQTTFFTV
jgi:hypothetical protein